MKFIYRALLFITLSGLATACKKSDDGAIIGTKLPPGKDTTQGQVPPVTTPPVKAPGIYAAGTIATDLYGSDTRATYWKNGVATKLSTKLSEARAIGVLGADVYVAGYNWENTEMAGYWKNGIFVKLRDGSDHQSFATDMSIRGNDVYICGWYTKTTFDEPSPVYWKNGVAVDLPAKGTIGDGYAYAYGITVSGNDVYVCGAYRLSKDRYAACYWKNKILNTYSDNTYASRANAIAVANGLVHLVGTVTPALVAFPHPKAAHWNDGKLDMLDMSTHSSINATDIVISNTDVYISGRASGSDELGLYWKNGTLVNIPNSWEANAITLDGSDVYVGGSYRTNVNVGELFGTYWKNSVPAFSHLSGADRSRIYDLLIIK